MAKDRIVEAVGFLVDASNYSALVQQMTRTIETWPNHPTQYVGRASCLNDLLALGVKDREKFEQVVALVERTRMQNPKVNKRDYQRNIMRDRRKRMAMALVLHEARSGPLKGEARTAEIAAIRARWDQAKAQYMAQQETMSGEERLVAIRQFWANLDRQLAANVANLHKKAVA
jgi:hypothetical protein